MKKIIISTFFICFALYSHAQTGHELWLQKKNAVPVNVLCAKNSPTKYPNTGTKDMELKKILS